MATRLLSFLNDIEQALLKESAANMGPMWTATRMVNYHQGLARMTLIPPKDAEDPAVKGGTILLQSFLLTDGSVCLKALVNWEGSPQSSLIAVYSKPQLSWKSEAARIASHWLAGPPANTAADSQDQPDLTPLLAVAS